MSTTPTEQAPEAAPEVAPVVPPATPNEPAPAVEIVLANNADTRLAQLLAQKAELEKATVPEESIPEIPAATPAAKIEEEPEIEPPAEETPKAKILPNRINTAQFTPEEQEAIALAKAFRERGEEVPSFSERIEMVKARHAPAASRTVEPVAEPDQELTALEAKLATLETEEAEEAKALGVESLRDKQKQIAKLERERESILHRKAQVATEQRSEKSKFDSARAAAIDQVHGMFPSAAEADSRLGQAIAAKIAEIQGTPGHRLQNALEVADVPVYLTKLVAAEVAAQLAAENGTTVAEELDRLGPKELKKNSAPPLVSAKPQLKKPALAGATASTPPLNQPPPKPLTSADISAMTVEQLRALRPKSQEFILRT